MRTRPRSHFAAWLAITLGVGTCGVLAAIGETAATAWFANLRSSAGRSKRIYLIDGIRLGSADQSKAPPGTPQPTPETLPQAAFPLIAGH